MVNQAEIHRMVESDNWDDRLWGVEKLIESFPTLADQQQGWEDLLTLTNDLFEKVSDDAASALSSAFSHIPNKTQGWLDLIKLVQNKDSYQRNQAAYALGSAFSYAPNTNEAWDFLHLLTDDHSVRKGTAYAIGRAYPHLPDKKQAFEDLHRLTYDESSGVRMGAAYSIGRSYPHLPDKKQAWDDMHRLTQDKDKGVRRRAAEALGSCYSHIPQEFKKQAWDDLNRLTSDTDSYVCASAYHSLGKACIFKAANAQNDIDLKKEMEAAIGYFEKCSQQDTWSKPAKFCLPFYRSFYALTFKKEETESEVQKYLSEAKIAVQGSKSREKLLEAIENLGNALKEAQKPRDFNAVKSDLNAYRRYCDRVCELLDTTEENAPGASRLIRKGLPIIDERIKGIIAEIQEKAKALCKQVKDTEYKEIGQQVNNVGQELSKVINPIRLDKEISRMLIPISAMCKKIPEEDRGEACEILKQINEEQYVEDKLSLISMFLSKISTQMDKKNIYVSIEKSKYAQVIIGNGNYQGQSSNSHQEKD